MYGPNPNEKEPMKGFPQVGYLKNFVTKDVPPYAVVGGNPAQVLKMRFDEETIQELLCITWWDWSAQKITQKLEAITNADIKMLREV